ncbi:hypothetical protein HK405_004540 [Cladochytrium tenue]|nr:hypothetical protein HK405_004540 [Cladochytrium tenue]
MADSDGAAAAPSPASTATTTDAAAAAGSSGSAAASTRDTLLAAQRATARRDFAGAARAFSELIDRHRLPNPALALLSRSTCLLLGELGDYESAARDCKAVLTLENVRVPEEIAPGCYATRPAAAARLATCSERTGDRRAAEAFKRMATELMKGEAADADRALKLKEEGNALFKEGRIRIAVSRWEEALVLDANNANVLSNLSLAYLKLNRLYKAAQVLPRCGRNNTQWRRTRFKKG